MDGIARVLCCPCSWCVLALPVLWFASVRVLFALIGVVFVLVRVMVCHCLWYVLLVTVVCGGIGRRVCCYCS